MKMHAEFETLKNDHKQLIDIHNYWKSQNDTISDTQIEVPYVRMYICNYILFIFMYAYINKCVTK